MRIVVLGSGAADYDMSRTCRCKVCSAARKRGGRNVRTYASAWVEPDLLIDCGPTCHERLCALGDAPVVRHVVVTHSHGDHCDAEALAAVARDFAPDGELRVYGNGNSLEKLAADCDECGLLPPAEMHVLREGKTRKTGRFTTLALPANHSRAHEDTLIFAISDGPRSLLYAADTAWPLDEAWNLLAEADLDLAIVEATFGYLSAGDHPDLMTQHLNFEEAERLMCTLRERGLLKPDAPFVLTHISQHYVPPHDDIEPDIASRAMTLAYDGMEIEI
ncbi:MAG: MBL fold metallo-hydrolase [Armatimonadota bacterium]